MKATSLIASACTALLPLAVPAEQTGKPLTDKASGDWIMLTGEISELRATQFHLNLDRGAVIVELDGYDADVKYDDFKIGQPVMVYGRLDDTGEATKTVEALQVYTLDTHKILAANPDDEEGAIADWRAGKYTTTLQGTVKSTGQDQMTVDTSLQTFTVNTGALPENAFDNEGSVRIEAGDRVKVHGTFSDGFGKTSTLTAVTVEELGQ